MPVAPRDKWPAGLTARVATDGVRQAPTLLRGQWTAARTESAAEPASANCGRCRQCSIPRAQPELSKAGVEYQLMRVILAIMCLAAFSPAGAQVLNASIEKSAQNIWKSKSFGRL